VNERSNDPLLRQELGQRLLPSSPRSSRRSGSPRPGDRGVSRLKRPSIWGGRWIASKPRGIPQLQGPAWPMCHLAIGKTPGRRLDDFPAAMTSAQPGKGHVGTTLVRAAMAPVASYRARSRGSVTGRTGINPGATQVNQIKVWDMLERAKSPAAIPDRPGSGQAGYQKRLAEIINALGFILLRGGKTIPGRSNRSRRCRGILPVFGEGISRSAPRPGPPPLDFYWR